MFTFRRSDVLLLVLLLGAAFAGAMEKLEIPWIPAPLEECLKREGVRLARMQNPVYLRGDFDGDGTADLAAVISLSADKPALLMCTKQGTQSRVLGRGGRFSDMPNDVFISPQWEAVSAVEARAEMPRCAGDVTNDGILMIWEDGLGLVAWNGKTFFWCFESPSAGWARPSAGGRTGPEKVKPGVPDQRK